MKYSIRPMTIADYNQLHALWLSTPGMGLNTTDDSRDGIARYLRRNPNTCFVAEQGGSLPARSCAVTTGGGDSSITPASARTVRERASAARWWKPRWMR